MRPLAMGAVLGTLALPAVAGAAPVAVSPRTVEANPVSLAFDAAGDGLASWRGLSGSADSSRPFHALAARTPAGEWRPAQTLPRSVISHEVALFGAGRVALVTERERPAGHARTRSLITLQLGTAVPLRLGATRILDRGPVRHVAYDGPRPTRFSPLVGASGIGTVVVVWERSFPRSRSGIWIATNGLHVRRIGPYGVSPSLLIAPDGSGMLTWRRGSRVLARDRNAIGAWGPIETVAHVGRYTEVAPASIAGADGRFAIGLTAITRSITGVHWRSLWRVQADGQGRTDELENATFTPSGATSYVTDNLRTLVTMTSDGHFHAAWPALRDGAVRAETDEGHFGSQATVDDVAAGPDGHWAMTWFDGTPNLVELGTAAPQTTSGFATEPSLAGSKVAYDPPTGRPVAIWSQGSQIVAGP
jgi:hypothetical protein